MTRDQTVVAVVVGLAFGIRAALAIGEPAYWDPATILDWLAILTWSLALATLVPGVWLLLALSVRPGEPGPNRWTTTSGTLALAGAAIAAVGNLLEHALELDLGGLLYVVGVLALTLGLVALSAALAFTPRRWLGLIAVATLVGMVAAQLGGLFLVAIAWLAFANLASRGAWTPPGPHEPPGVADG